MKKFIIALVILVLVGIGVWQNLALQKTSYEGIAEVNGRLNLNRLDIATLYPGRIQEILVKEGDDVRQHQDLARLSTTQVDAQLSIIKAKQQQAQEALQRAKAEQNAIEQQLNLAHIELANAQQLYRDKLISRTELARHQTQVKATQAKIQVSQAAQAEAQAVIEQATAQMAQVQDMHDDYTIKAPIDGRVEYKIAELGSVIPAGGKVLSLVDPLDVYINVFLPPSQTNPLRIGDEARLRIEGIDAVFPVSIQFIAAEAQFTPKSVETQEERTKLMFKVKLALDKTMAAKYTGLFKGGMTALAYIKYDQNAAWPEDLAVKLPE